MSDPEKELFERLIYTSFFVPLILAVILIWFVIFYQKKKHKNQLEKKDLLLREQNLIITKQQALEVERTRIAAEMHDDLGGGLTTIKFLSQKMLRKIDDEKQRSQIEKIVLHAQTLVGNMSEIIWAMNAGFDTLESLIAYTRRNAHEYLDEHEIKLIFDVKGEIEGYQISGEKRRHIYLTIKEAIHNIVKHANATKVELHFEIQEELSIIIQDNGKGISNSDNLLGNGLKNMKHRMDQINGKIDFQTENGLKIEIKIPVQDLIETNNI